MNDKIKRIVCIVTGVVLGGWLTFFGARELLNSKKLADHGKATQAEVIDSRERVSGRLRRRSYYLTIAFETGQGVSLQKEVKVSSETFHATRQGGSVKAYYLPEDPTVCAAGETVDLWYGNLVWGLLAIGGAVFLGLTMNKSSAIDDLAQRIEARLKPLMVERFQYGPARAEEFTHLDLAFYDKARAYLEDRGYRFLADERNLTVQSDVTEGTFLRVLVGSGLPAVAFLYHLKTRKAGTKESKVMDLETWFSNGQFVTTSNAERAGVFDSPPGIHALHLPAETLWDQVLEAHQKQVNDFLAKNPGTEAVKLKTIQDVRRFQDELQRTKSEFRRANGLSKAELERFVRGRAGIDVEELHAKLTQRLRQQSQAVGAS